MLRAHSIDPTMIRYLEEIGVGRRHMNGQGVAALRNLIELAESEATEDDGAADLNSS